MILFFVQIHAFHFVAEITDLFEVCLLEIVFPDAQGEVFPFNFRCVFVQESFEFLHIYFCGVGCGFVRGLEEVEIGREFVGRCYVSLVESTERCDI